MDTRNLSQIKIPKWLAIIILLIVAIFGTNLQQAVDTSSIPTIDGASTTEWTESIAPNYVVQVGKAQFESSIAEGHYTTETDSLKRPTYVIGNVTYRMMREGSERERENLPKPTGWPKNAEVDIELSNGDIYHGWFWNRSHLLAKSLGGPDTKDNLVPGTRMQNVGNNDGTGGMAYTETKVRNYLKKHKNVTVLYEVTPVYVANELIPRTCIIDIQSSDYKLDEEVIVYNAQKGYIIDYNTGTWNKI